MEGYQDIPSLGSCSEALDASLDAASLAAIPFRAALSSSFSNPYCQEIRNLVHYLRIFFEQVKYHAQQLGQMPLQMTFTRDFSESIDNLTDMMKKLTHSVAPIFSIWRKKWKRNCGYSNTRLAELAQLCDSLTDAWREAVASVQRLKQNRERTEKDEELICLGWSKILNDAKVYVIYTRQGERRSPAPPDMRDDEIMRVFTDSNNDASVFALRTYSHYSYWQYFRLALWLETRHFCLTPLENDVYGGDVQLRDFFVSAIPLLRSIMEDKKVGGPELCALAQMIKNVAIKQQRKVKIADIREHLLEAVAALNDRTGFSKDKSIREFFRDHYLSDDGHGIDDAAITKALACITSSPIWRQHLEDYNFTTQTLINIAY